MQETISYRESEQTKDSIESTLQSTAQNILIFAFGLSPLVFVPVAFIPLDYIKTTLVIVCVLFAIIFFSLSILRSGRILFSAPLALWALWAVAIATAVSAVLSGDMYDAFVGDDIGVHTGVFAILLALVATTILLVLRNKEAITRLYVLLTGSAVVLALFHLVRLVFGPDILVLGVFNSLVSTPIGGWNDLALFFGLSIILSLVALEQLSLTRWGKALFISVIAFSLLMLAVVNFVAVWVVLGLVSLIVLMYSLTKERFMDKTLTLEGKQNAVSFLSVGLSLAVFIVSLTFIIGGGAVGGSISKVTGISYIEVRPSFEATVDIARNVFKENAFVGIGPNKFVDAWRLYKDPSINMTAFWATDFKGGSGYITTAFVTTGIAGMIAWIVFFIMFLYIGFKLLFRPAHVDRLWYFIGSSSFAAAAYLWGMSALYVPGVAILLLATVFTAILFVTYATVVEVRSLSFSMEANKRAGIILVGLVMVIIVGASSALYYMGRHYASVHTFAEALSEAQVSGDLAVVERSIASAYSIVQNDGYASQLASFELAQINTLAGLSELTNQQQQELQSSVQNGINAALMATQGDPTDARNWSTLGGIYSVLAEASVEGAKDRAREAFAKARMYDPTNPLHTLLEAQLNSRSGDLASARSKALEAIGQKSNYTDALFFLAQIDIAEGKTADAITTTLAIISLEPNNPARHYQLGVLHSASGNLDASIAAFEQAIALDVNYANARYFLALAYAQKGKRDGALEQLQKVLDLNPGNTDVISLMDRIRSGAPLEVTQESQQVSEPESVTSEDNAITTTEAPATSLITPVNGVGEEEVLEEGEAQ
jgi:tetratricopeptide (TPR) repeat protein